MQTYVAVFRRWQLACAGPGWCVCWHGLRVRQSPRSTRRNGSARTICSSSRVTSAGTGTSGTPSDLTSATSATSVATTPIASSRTAAWTRIRIQVDAGRAPRPAPPDQRGRRRPVSEYAAPLTRRARRRFCHHRRHRLWALAAVLYLRNDLPRTLARFVEPPADVACVTRFIC
jgi:hypothetical protein